MVNLIIVYFIISDACFIGTGKSVTGAHLAYAFALKNRISPVGSDVKQPTGVPGEAYLLRKPVMYCGSSNKAVDRVLGKQVWSMPRNMQYFHHVL